MGKDVELLCQARGDPEPEVYWVGPNGKNIEDSTKFRVRNIFQKYFWIYLF
jgi:hypothetical protein